jgi:hypothetical protein
LTPWADPDLCCLLVRQPSWWGFGHQYDFNRFIVIFFLNSGDLDHTLDIDDPFFSLSLSLPQTQ